MKLARTFLAVSLALLALLLAACGDDDSSPATATPAAGSSQAPNASPAPAGFALTSSAFAEGGQIPKQYSCDGDKVSPPLAWTAAPAGTKAFALLMDDPDAPRGTFDHWVVSDIPASTSALPAGASKGALPAGSVEGKNGSGSNGYTGPCPPNGPAHHYHFRLLALDAPLGLPAGKSKADVEQAAKDHTLATAELIGTYQR